jgi:hypothetical protein
MSKVFPLLGGSGTALLFYFTYHIQYMYMHQINMDEIDRSHSMHGEVRNVYKILVERQN